MITVQGLARRAQNVWRRTGINPHGETGWTEDPLLSTGAKEMHVALESGSDLLGDGSAAHPFKTIGRALQEIGPSSRGDRILLLRNESGVDSFGSWNKSGLTNDPMILGAYGDLALPRPVLRCPSGGILLGQVNDVWIKDIEFTPQSYNGSANVIGINFESFGQNILVEGCYVHGFSTNINITPPNISQRAVNCRVRRNVIADAWALHSTGHSQGMYAWRTDGLIVEQNVFDHNGWNETVPGAWADQWNHGLYMAGEEWDVIINDVGIRGFPDTLSTGTIIRDNFFSRSSSHGTQARSAGVVEGNVAARCAVGILVGSGDNVQALHTPATIRRNFVDDGRDIYPKIDISSATWDYATLTITKVGAFAYYPPGTAVGKTFHLTSATGCTPGINFQILNNTDDTITLGSSIGTNVSVTDVLGYIEGYPIGWGFLSNRCKDMLCEQNVAANCTDGTFQIAFQFSRALNSMVVGNIGSTWDQNSVPISSNPSGNNLPVNWDLYTGTPNDWNGDASPGYPADTRTVDGYATIVCGFADYEELLDNMRLLRRGAWIDLYSPTELSKWLLGGFGI